jgi:hypothetical protein
MFIHCINFLIDELLWMLAWGWCQLGFSIFLTLFSFIFFTPLKIHLAILLTLISYAFAVGAYFILVAGLFIYYFKISFIAGDTPNVYNPLCASLFLALIYSILQLFFYYSVGLWYKRSFLYFFLLSCICNMIAALLGSLCIKITF